MAAKNGEKPIKINKLCVFFLTWMCGFSGAQNLQGSGAAAPLKQGCQAVNAQTCALALSLGRGINMGNMLEAPREGDWGIRLEPAYINLVAEKFKTVRVPVRWTNHAAPTADATLDEFFASRVDKALDALLSKSLVVIVNTHHYNQLFGDKLHPNEFAVDPAVLEQRLVNIWHQLALRYKNRSPKLIFELLNEPHGSLKSDDWNALQKRLIDTVREIDPNRVLLVGSTYWNHPRDLNKLKLPPDRNLIVAIHMYDPYEFTHQGISWMPQFPKGPTCCSDSQKKTMADVLETAVKWSQQTGYPLHLGEFGSYNQGDMESRETYTRTMRDLAEKYSVGWTYWEFGSSFGAYDPKTGSWIEPLRKALVD